MTNTFDTLHPIIIEDVRHIVQADVPWDSLDGRTVLITGAYGFLASYLVYTLLLLNRIRFKTPARIIALGRSRERAYSRFGVFLENNEMTLCCRDTVDAMSDIKDVDYVIHAASLASPKYFGLSPVEVMLPNILGTYQLLELAKEQQIEKMLFVSSSEVYVEPNSSQGEEELSESLMGTSDPTNVRSCYCESKRAGETMCASWAFQHGVPVSIVRPFHTYGPGMSLDDGRVFSDFVANIVNNQDIVLRSSGKASRAFCYLSDATVGFWKVLLQGESGQAYNVGNPNEDIQIKELAETLVALFPKRNLSVVCKPPAQETRAGYIASRVTNNLPCIERMLQLGWEPKVTIQDGFSRAIRSYQ